MCRCAHFEQSRPRFRGKVIQGGWGNKCKGLQVEKAIRWEISVEFLHHCVAVLFYTVMPNFPFVLKKISDYQQNCQRFFWTTFHWAT